VVQSINLIYGFFAQKGAKKHIWPLILLVSYLRIGQLQKYLIEKNQWADYIVIPQRFMVGLETRELRRRQ
jgi:hypothetical protein